MQANPTADPQNHLSETFTTYLTIQWITFKNQENTNENKNNNHTCAVVSNIPARASLALKQGQ